MGVGTHWFWKALGVLGSLFWGILWRLVRLGWAGGGKAAGVLSVWLWWERFTIWWWKLRPLFPDSILSYKVNTYKGRPLSLPDGVIVMPGDGVIDLHMNNPILSRKFQEGASTWELIKEARKELRVLSSRIASGALPDVVAVRGTTLLVVPCIRLGFTAFPLRNNLWNRFRFFFFVGLRAIYHPHGWKAAERLVLQGWPHDVWMSKDQLIHRFPPM